MVYTVNSADYVHGKREEALEFLKKAVSQFKKFGVEVEIMRMTTPGPGQHARFWTLHKYASPVEMAEIGQKNREDAEWMATVRAAHAPGGCMAYNTFTSNNFQVL